MVFWRVFKPLLYKNFCMGKTKFLPTECRFKLSLKILSFGTDRHEIVQTQEQSDHFEGIVVC